MSTFDIIRLCVVIGLVSFFGGAAVGVWLESR